MERGGLVRQSLWRTYAPLEHLTGALRALSFFIYFYNLRLPS